MGVKGLWNLIHEKAPDAIESIRAREGKGTVVAVDAALVITQYRTAVAHVGLQHDALHAVLQKAISLLRHEITPIFVFDGRPPAEKLLALAARRPAPVPSASEVKECQRLLTTMGIAWVQAPGEADVVCAEMTRRKEADAVLSEDMDMFPQGATVVLRQWSHRGGVRVRTSVLLSSLGLTRAQFLDLCLLLGTDYTPSLPGIGPKKAWKLVQEHVRPEDLAPAIPWQAARDLFGPPVTYTVERPLGDPDFWSHYWDILDLSEERQTKIEEVLYAHRRRQQAARSVIRSPRRRRTRRSFG